MLDVFARLLAPPGREAGGRRRSKKIRIGFSMDTLKEERWHRDRDLLVKRAGELGAEVLVQAANGNDALQNSQAENMLTQGVDVLLVAPHNGKTAAVIVEAAHRAGVPVIAYDRLINDADVDLYMSFDNERVGEMQAEYLVARKPRGNYVVIGGAPDRQQRAPLPRGADEGARARTLRAATSGSSPTSGRATGSPSRR